MKKSMGNLLWPQADPESFEMSKASAVLYS
jgi:hypothetical protein